MIRQAALHRLGPWLIGLFIIAQTCGVIQLLSDHVAHLTESQLSLSDGTVMGNTSHGHHHYRGDADGAVQHHELQDLSGALACPIGGCELALTYVTIKAYVSEAIVENDPILIERPPKSFLSL
jgi:hypothetical protein